MKAAMRAVRRKSSFSSDHPAAPIQDEQHSTVPPLPASSPSLSFQPPGRTTPQLSDPARVSAFGMDAILAMAAVSSADSSLGRLAEVQEEPHPSPSPPPRQTTSPLYEKVFGSSVVPESPPSQPTSVVNGRGGHAHVTSVERAGRPSTANSANTNSDYLSSSNSHHVQSRSTDNHHRAGLAPTQPNLGAGPSDVSLTSYKSASTEYRSKFVEVESPEVQATHPAPATAKERKMSSDSKGRGRSASRPSGGGEDRETRGEQKEGEGKRRSFSLPRRSRSKQRSASDAPPSPSDPPPMPLPIGAQVPPPRTSNGTRPTSTSPQPPSPSMPVQQQQQQQQQHPHQQERTSQAHTLQQHQHRHAPGSSMPAPPANASRRASALPPPASIPSPEKEKSGGGLFGRMRSGKKKSKDSAARDTHPSQIDARQAQSLGPASSGRVAATRQSMVPTPHSQPILNGTSHAQAHVTHDPRRKTSGSGGIVPTSKTGRSPVPVAQSVNSVSNENEAAAAKLRERLAVLAVKEQERGVALVAKEQERQAAELREQERVATLAVKEEQRVAALAAAQEAERSAAEAKERERAERRARKEAAAAYEAELKQKTRAAALAAEVERVAAARRGAEAQAKMRQARNRTSVIQPDDAALPNARPASRPPPSQKRMSIVAGPQAQQRFSQAQPLVDERGVSQAAGPQSRKARSPVHNAGDLSSAESNIEPITPREEDAVLGHQNRSWSSDEPSKGPTGLARRSWSTRQPNGWAPGEVPAATGPVEQGMPPRAGLTDSPELDPMPEDDPDAVPGRPNSRFGLVIDASEKASVDLDREVAKQGKQSGSPFQSPQSRTSELAPSERSERDSQLLAAYRGQQPREYVQNITRRTIPAPSQLASLPRSPSARYTFEEVTYHVCVPKLRRPSRSRRKVDAETDDGESVPSSPAQIVVDWRTEERRVYVRYSDLFACLYTLASADLLEALIAPLEGLEIKTLRQTCVGVRRVLDGMQGRELVLRQFLSEHGYQTWRPAPLVAVQAAPGLGANTAPASPHAVIDPLPLSLTDLDSFLLGQDLLAEYPLVATSYIQTPQELDPRIPRLARASTRAYNRVVARLRIQPHFRLPSPPAPPQATSAPASPNLKRSPGNSPLLGVNKAQSRDARTNSYYPSTAANVQQGGSPGQSPAASPSLSPHRPGQRGTHNAEGLSPAVSTHSLNSVAASSVSSSSATPDPPAKVTPSLYRPGRAALFRVWVPSMDGLWLDDDEVAACEAEMFRAGVWGHLKPGDIVWDTAIGNVGNVGKMIFDGRYLRDLSYVFDPFGHLPSWVNAFHFSPSHFHNVIRSSTDQPIVFLDVLPWREAILTSLRLVQDRVDTPGRYRIARWVHRASFRIAPGQIVSAEGEGLEVVDEGWAGTIYVEADGTSEAARELVLRCAGPEPSAQLRAELISRAAHTADPNPNPLAPLPPLRLTGKEGERAETTSAWAILRERSRPGQIWIRPVTENRMTV